jgi:membrane protein HdeD
LQKFIVKLVANGVVVVPLLLWYTEATFWQAAVTAVILSGIAYLLGDQLILRVTNNTVATLADAALAFVYFWSVASLMDWTLTFGENLMITLILGVVEAVYHRYLGNRDRRTA